MTEIHLSLVSHTNVGKTALARTLLQRDVGEVRDAPHVTERAEEFALAAAGDHRLLLWDTPGFGDTARLLGLLRAQERPLGWLWAQVWDRFRDRGLWASQQAARHVQERSDAVLYLVNATEEPGALGYVRHELDLLAWIGRPVLLLLNQTGAGEGAELARLATAWERFAAPWPIVGGVLPLDAFTRCWVEETVLFARLAPLLAPEKRAAMAELARAWDAAGWARFREAVGALAAYLAGAAAARQPLSGPRAGRLEKRRALDALGRRLERSTRELMARLLALHGIAGDPPAALERRLGDLAERGTVELTPQKGALLGGAVSGAMGGLAADLLAGGLTFGGGLVAGARLGALGGAGLSRAAELVQLGGAPQVSWAAPFLDGLARQALLRYLAVAHWGRGRGELRELAEPESWVEPVEAALAAREGELRRLWKAAGRGEPEAGRDLETPLAELVGDCLETLLAERYPEARPPATAAPGASALPPALR
ncbi:MAG: GTPase domain-containing protein [Thermoanaerobaculia bacterium]|nr:GTPase domain-containing protein [Thermoanaerobaculia bacterium]